MDLNMMVLVTFTASFIVGWVNAAAGDPYGIQRFLSRVLVGK
jgi:hypothetical protein